MVVPKPRRLPPLPSPRDILRMYGIKARKKLSQNFILDPRTLNRLVETAGPVKGKTVVEVGPGPGGITRAILGNGAREVHVIEKDKRFIPSLELLREASGNILHINMGDALNYNMSRLFAEELRKPWETADLPDILMIGNLPFNISTPLIIRYMKAMQKKENIFSYGRVPCHLTFQHEVAHRMIAPPGDKERCRLSIFCQNFCNVRYRYTLKGGAFVPPPQVEVAFVSLTPLIKPYIQIPFYQLEVIVTTVFHGKRKFIRNSMLKLFPPSSRNRYERVDRLLGLADLKPDRMAISLDMSEMEKIVVAYKHIVDNDPKLQKYIHPEIVPLLSDYQAGLHAKQDNLLLEGGGGESQHHHDSLDYEDEMFPERQ